MRMSKFSGVRPWVMVAALAWLAACAELLGPRNVEVSQAQLQQWVDRKFPLDNRLLELLDVRLATPRLTLRSESNRIATDFEVTVSDRLFKSPHRGALALDYALRFEPSDNTVRATKVRIERVEIDGAPALLQRQLDRIALRLAEQALDEQPVYTLRSKDLEAVQGRGYRPGDIRVTPAGLAITLLPIEAR
jgi:Protein of unknown function (DUF1439)